MMRLTSRRLFRFRMLLAVLSMTHLAGRTMSAEPAPVMWKTSGSVTFASADGADVWLIEASGGLEAPKASPVRLRPSGATRGVTVPGYAFSPSADRDYVYVVVDQ